MRRGRPTAVPAALIAGALLAVAPAAANAGTFTWWAYSTTPGVTSCTQDDGLTDYPLDLSAGAAGCYWRRPVALPAFGRVTGLRAFVEMNGYYGSWSVGALASDGSVYVGATPANNIQGRKYSQPLDLAVAAAGGTATVSLIGGEYAGAFIAPTRSGFEIQYLDTTAPNAGASPAISTKVGAAVPAPPIDVVDDSPLVASARLDWGDGATQPLTFSAPTAWDGGIVHFSPAIPVAPHRYTAPGSYTRSIAVTDAAGNVGTANIDQVQVKKPPDPRCRTWPALIRRTDVKIAAARQRAKYGSTVRSRKAGRATYRSLRKKRAAYSAAYARVCVRTTGVVVISLP